jgi:hypothetical protein
MATKIVDVRKDQAEIVGLPASQKVFHVDYTDPETSRQYGGDFTVKRLNIGDMRQVGIRRAQLNGGLSEESLDRNISYVNAMLAHLEIALVKTPDWWKPQEMYNADVVADVYQEVMLFEETFRRTVQKQSTSVETNSETTVEG